MNVTGNALPRACAALALMAAIAGSACRDPGARSGTGGPDDAAGEFDADGPADAGAEFDAEETGYQACPASPGAGEDPDALLDLAAALQGDGEPGAAATCAEMAAELVPDAVEAHHLRATALVALGRHAEAREAFAMALALDPDDPDTLAAVADYYINGTGDRRREETLLGLTYARRGAENVTERWREDDFVHGELRLREAQALNDLGEPKEALAAANAALELNASPVDAHHERGVSLFHLGRFSEAEEAFRAYLDRSGGGARAPYAHYHLGLIHERQGDEERALEQFARATEGSAGELRAPLAISEEVFREKVDAAITALSAEERSLALGIDIEIADLPDDDDLEASAPPLAPTILGLYRGHPHDGPPAGARGDDGEAPSERSIVLYRKNLARVAADGDELSRQIRDTLRHELGHMRGLSEADLRRRGLE